MRINKHDTQGTKPLLGKGELGYDDYAAGGDVGRVYVGTGSENIALAERLEANMMTKAQFNALAEERKVQRAGSGWDEMGKHSVGYSSVNNGIICSAYYINAFQLGWNFTSQLAGDSKTNYPLANVNGVLHKLFSINRSTTSYEINKIILPTAPTIYPHDTVLTSEQIASGVIKHADASNSGLIVNGKNFVDTSGWTAVNAVISINSNGQLVVDDSAGAGDNSSARQLIPTITGKEYILQIKVSSITGTGFFVNFEPTLTPSLPVQSLISSMQSTGVFTIKFTAQSQKYLAIGGAGNSIVHFDNIAVYPADAISRSDLVFLESWHEDINEKNFVYPLGNTQYLGGNTDSLTGITNGNFTGFETYSLFGNWQTPSALIGKGYIWSNLTEAQKRAFIANPENNCYLDGDKTIQVRYRVRVVQGLGDNWASVNTSGLGTLLCINDSSIYPKGKNIYTQEFGGTTYGSLKFGSYVFGQSEIGAYCAIQNDAPSYISGYDGTKCFALPIALVHRRNQGMYHNVYNPNGTKLASDGLDYFRTTVSFTSISDCFDPAKLLATSGYIGTVSGRPDGLFYDQVHESDITDLRNSSKKVEDYNRLISREFNKLVAGTTRGKEGEWEIKYYFSLNITAIAPSVWQGFTSYKFAITPPVEYRFGTYAGINHNYKAYYINGSNITEIYAIQPDGYFFIGNPTVSSGYVVIATKSTRTKSNTLLHCDIIGNPTNYPTAWKQSRVFGTPLIVAEDGTSLLPDGVRDTFKLSRKANATPLLCLRSTDSGATWTSFTPTFSTTTNEITLTNEPANNLVMVYYQTKTSMAVPVVNSEVLSFISPTGINYNDKTQGAYLVDTLIGKSPIGASAPTLLTRNLLASSLHPIAKSFDSGYGFDAPTHSQMQFYNSYTPAVKILPYLTRTNGKAYLNLVFKEMKYNGTSWGDNDKFNIVGNVSTTTDNNAQTVLIGQKTVELPYFIAGDE